MHLVITPAFLQAFQGCPAGLLRSGHEKPHESREAQLAAVNWIARLTAATAPAPTPLVPAETIASSSRSYSALRSVTAANALSVQVAADDVVRVRVRHLPQIEPAVGHFMESAVGDQTTLRLPNTLAQSRDRAGVQNAKTAGVVWQYNRSA